MIGKGYKTRLLNPHDEFWDRRLGVHTFGFRPGTGSGDTPNWQVHYTPAPYSSIFESLQRAGLGKDDVFTDLGSGMGRAVFAASWMGAKQANGIEILPDLAETAEQNRRKSKLSNRSINFTCANARDADLGSTTVLFMFHSFGADTLAIVLQSFERQRGANARIVYMNPVFNEAVKEQGWLKRCELIKPAKRLISTTTNWDVAIWYA
jgi:precorrin-6B methylase 2